MAKVYQKFHQLIQGKVICEMHFIYSSVYQNRSKSVAPYSLTNQGKIQKKTFPRNFLFSSFKINKAVVPDSKLNQWVDLGDLSEACITRPDTCGPEGTAVAVWVKIHSCPNGHGFLSSLHSNNQKTGFNFWCFGGNIR